MIDLFETIAAATKPETPSQMIQIKTETKHLNASLRMFDRLLHAGMIVFCRDCNGWKFTNLKTKK